MAERDNDLKYAGWDPIPRWLRRCGLPKVIGHGPFSVLEVLLCKHLQRMTRRVGGRTKSGRMLVPFTQSELAGLIGVSERSARDYVHALERHGLVRVVKKGWARDSRSAPSWAEVVIETLLEVYAVTCNEIHQSDGGLRGALAGDDLLEEGIIARHPIFRERAVGVPREWLTESIYPVDIRWVEEALSNRSEADWARISAHRTELATLDYACRRYAGLPRGERPRILQKIAVISERLPWLPEALAAAVEKVLHDADE